MKYILFYIAFLVVLTGCLYFLKPLKDFLDSEALSFKLGALRFSIYSILTSLLSVIFLTLGVLWVLKFGEKRLRAIVNVKASNREIFVKGFYILVCTAAFFVLLGILGIDLTALVVVGSSLLFGMGFGIKKIAADFITGFVILFEKSFEVGDLIELNDSTVGFVRQINARFVLVETFCGKEVMVPNEEFMNQKIVNLTHNNTKLRLEVKIQVSYAEDINKVESLILDVAKNHPLCLKDPEPFCLLQDVKEGIVFFSLRFWVADVREGFLVPESKVRSAVWERLQKEGIKIPMVYRVVVDESKAPQVS